MPNHVANEIRPDILRQDNYSVFGFSRGQTACEKASHENKLISLRNGYETATGIL